MQRYSISSTQQLVSQLVVAAGATTATAARLADALVDADLHGASTHGVSRLSIYLKRAKLGLIDPRAQLDVQQQRPAVLRVDANHGFGQVQLSETLDHLIPLAGEFGIAAATIRQSQHCGALSYYGNQVAQQNMILLSMTNAEPAMSPAGGSQAFFGTNPIAVSFPTGKGFPVKIDLSTSIIARGNIIAAAKAGRAIPEGWGLDPEGCPTTDAEAALAGTVLTMAGHKGYALAMLVEVFSGVLSGAAIGDEIGSMYKDLDRRQNVGHFLCLCDIQAFIDVEEFKHRIDATINRLKAGRLRPGVDEILVPGERSFRTAQQNTQLGIPIDPNTLDELKGLCVESGVPFSLEETH